MVEAQNSEAVPLTTTKVVKNATKYERIPETNINGSETYLLVKHSYNVNNSTDLLQIRLLNDAFDETVGTNLIDHFDIINAFVIKAKGYTNIELLQLQNLTSRDFPLRFELVDAEKYQLLKSHEIEEQHKKEELKNQIKD